MWEIENRVRLPQPCEFSRTNTCNRRKQNKQVKQCDTFTLKTQNPTKRTDAKNTYDTCCILFFSLSKGRKSAFCAHAPSLKRATVWNSLSHFLSLKEREREKQKKCEKQKTNCFFEKNKKNNKPTKLTVVFKKKIERIWSKLNTTNKKTHDYQSYVNEPIDK